jgi:Flp pilus assembly pilin Flp
MWHGQPDDDRKEVGTEQRAARRRRSEDGASLVEYVLLVSLIVLVCIFSVGYFGTSLNGRYSKVNSAIEANP